MNYLGWDSQFSSTTEFSLTELVQMFLICVVIKKWYPESPLYNIYCAWKIKQECWTCLYPRDLLWKISDF